MKFTHYDLNHRNGGKTVVVTLKGNAANVLLMDSDNFRRYQSGQDYRYHGGHYTRSPARISIPHAGNWHVVIDLGGHVGQVKTSVQVLG